MESCRFKEAEAVFQKALDEDSKSLDILTYKFEISPLEFVNVSELCPDQIMAINLIENPKPTQVAKKDFMEISNQALTKEGYENYSSRIEEIKNEISQENPIS